MTTTTPAAPAPAADTDRYRDLVAAHLDRLTADFGDPRRYRTYFDDPVVFRHSATTAQRLVVAGGVAGWVSIAVIAATTTLGYGLLNLDPTDPSAGGVVGFFLGLLLTAGIFTLRHRWLEPDRLRLSFGIGREIYSRVDTAIGEMTAAADLGDVEAGQLAAAANNMRPGIEEILDEQQRLSAALNRSYGAAQAVYRDQLSKAIDNVEAALIGIVAELDAAAEVVFSRRTDLLVPVPQTAQTPALPVTVLTDAGQRTLEESRELLARIAQQIC